MCEPGDGPRRYQGDIMKKRMKRLVLSRETLRELDEGKMQGVIGASDGSGIQCAGSYCLYASCDSCNTCGTQFC
jgi:hypothetical protein